MGTLNCGAGGKNNSRSLPLCFRFGAPLRLIDISKELVERDLDINPDSTPRDDVEVVIALSGGHYPDSSAIAVAR